MENRKPKTKSSKGEKPSFNRYRDDSNPSDRKDSRPVKKTSSRKEFVSKKKSVAPKQGSFAPKPFVAKAKQTDEPDGSIRLNKYLSNAGICSRREADELIASGVVKVNGNVITEMGFKVKPTDVVNYGGQTLRKERNVYLILNKPKDYITTYDDPEERKTVMNLIQGACRERVYPVGRLDRNTTGLLLFTNDGELTKRLTHPRYGIKKIYHVELDKAIKQSEMSQIMEGIELEDGIIKPDQISYVGSGVDKTQVGIELHSGKNRIVRRIFEHFGYKVKKLDRVMFGPLTKKDLPRGRWRFLTERELGMLKMTSVKD